MQKNQLASLEVSSHGHGPAPGPALGHGLLAHVGTLKTLLEVHLGLPELGQVECGNLFSLLDLLLVSADLQENFNSLVTYLRVDSSYNCILFLRCVPI